MNINTLLLGILIIGTVYAIIAQTRAKQAAVRPVPAAATVRQEAMNSVLSDEFFQAHLKLSQTVTDLDAQFRDKLQQTQQAMLLAIQTNATQVFDSELAAYRQALTDAQAAVVQVTTTVQTEVAGMRQAVAAQAQLAADSEKTALLQRFDERLDDVVGQYLDQALGEEVDLGAQKEYIISQLEHNKVAIKRELDEQF